MAIEIGKKIRLLRLSKGLTQEQLADKLSVTAQSVSKWENDVTAPDIALLPQISVELGVTIDELFSMTDEARLVRIENLLISCSRDTCIPERDFDNYTVFLKELKENSSSRGRAAAAMAWLYNQQADAYRAIAAENAKDAIEADPYDKSNHSVLCAAMNGAQRDWYMANHRELTDYYLKFVEKHPDNIPALQLLLDNLVADNRADEAEYVLSKLRRCDDSCRTLWYEAQICYLRGDRDGMEDALSRMTQQYAEDWLAWSYKGDLYARLAEYDKAEECWHRGYELQPHPRMTDALLCLAEVSTIKKDYRKAATYYRECVSLLENDHGVTEGDGVTKLKMLALMCEKR